MDGDELQNKINQIYDVIIKLKTKHSQRKIDWLIKIWDREFGLVESLCENFLDNTDMKEYASKILMILRKLYEYLPDIVYDQYMECKQLPKAIAKYIKCTALEDMTPDAFLLLKEFFNEVTYTEILEDNQFIESLMEALTIINKAEYFDAVWDLLLYRFQAYCPDEERPEFINEQTEFFLNLILEHRSGRMFIETIIHLMNRRGSEAERTINWLTVIILNEKTYSKVFSNDKQLIVDILDEEVDKDMSNHQHEALINLLFTILHVSKDTWYENKLDIIKVSTC